jgi:hypothetical protein
LDVKTSQEKSLKLSDEEIICFDEASLILKKISMLKKEEDSSQNKFFAKIVITQITK